MKGEYTLIRTDGTHKSHEITSADILEQAQKDVGGHIESIPFFNKYQGKPCAAFCNEEGKLDGLPVNDLANKLWAMQSEQPPDDVLVGNIVIITGDAELMRAL